MTVRRILELASISSELSARFIGNSSQWSNLSLGEIRLASGAKEG
jgi:hypothetical protein